jgi:hypothetical protein
MSFSSKSSRFSHTHNTGLIVKIYMHDVIFFCSRFSYFIIKSSFKVMFLNANRVQITQNASIWRATGASCAFYPLGSYIQLNGVRAGKGMTFEIALSDTEGLFFLVRLTDGQYLLRSAVGNSIRAHDTDQRGHEIADD